MYPMGDPPFQEPFFCSSGETTWMECGVKHQKCLSVKHRENNWMGTFLKIGICIYLARFFCDLTATSS